MHRFGLVPGVAPVRRRVCHACSPSGHTKSFDGERSLVLHHEVDGSAELVSENGKGFGLAMFFPKFLDVALRGRVGAKEENSSFGECPFQMHVSDFCATGPESFPGGAFFTFDESCIGGEVLDTFKASDVMDLIEHGHSEDVADAGDGFKSEEVAGVMDFCFPSEEELEFLDE